ncbi:2-hydroxy-3-oxopropionate reductase [Halanaerobium saccharolyticum subsp. saccharolyticum DSM 6643]|uniref:2-hydroxy-3-oxopropionate reductase n=1 Tax=Halanaerobium saccharolyticum subsp. saccharolyticum DSM 6643 TaxID=1293054 RepID=M5DZE0_9FIRM|nr:NAD(P)-dependent oxidoreductase [Halanaerobium saccharolyticum]CCU78563.1 2-hydroxy-3-oxopropionate reductase [Halanaerobium saccharolyticum subsp. saccharolyticum DSM 6643]
MNKIGFIGLGIMGESMCANLLKKRDEEILVYDLNEEKIEMMVKQGAVRAASNQDLAAKADIIISMVPKGEHVKAVYNEIAEELNEDKIWIDMSTINPAISKDIAAEVKKKGSVMVEAPVVKSKSAAEAGTLGIYFGGDKEVYNQVKDLLLCMGENIIHLGDNGSGLMMKICHNMLVGEVQNAVNEMMTLAQKSDIEIDDFAKAISYGGGQNFYLDAKAESIKNRDFSTAFSVENMNKDVNIAAEIKEDLNLNLPGIDLVKDVYQKAMEENYGKEDFSASIKAVEKRL